MKNKFTITTALFLSATLLGLNLGINQAIAQGIEAKIEAQVNEDDLNNLENIPWGGDNYPYSKVTKIVDTLSPEYAVGYVVIDRHGIDNSSFKTNDSSFFGMLGGITKQPFTQPVPGKEVYISLWGAKAEGCFVQLIIQIAPKQQLTAEQITPTLLELGVGGRKLQLNPPKGATPQLYSGNYEFTITENKVEQTYTGVRYVSKMLFGLDKTGAQILMNAPADKNVRARITMPNNTINFEIGKKTVERWKTIYSVNPTCENLNAAQ